MMEPMMAEAVTVILERMRGLVRDSGWTQGAYARTSKGNPIGWNERNASCFCITGAMMRAWVDSLFSYDLGNKARTFVINAIEASYPGAVVTWHGIDLARWNDAPGRTREEVLDVIEKAIIASREK